MKILILGTGKTGTTVMVYKVAGGLPNCHAFSGGRPGKHVGDYKNAVYKHTYEQRKGKDFKLFKEHMNQVHYDRKIWMARDPRDAAVSRMLYRWHKGVDGNKKQYDTYLDLIFKKEKSPRSIAFAEICRYTGHNGWPRTVEQVIEAESYRYQQMVDFVNELGDEWFLYTFEAMVDGKFKDLNNYLGFEVDADATVPAASGKAKVIRKKSTGDWRQWFTDEDVTLFKQAFLPYMKIIGYDCDDWTLDPNPIIEPEYSSNYIQRLSRNAKKNAVLRFLEPITQRLPFLSSRV